MYLVNTRMDIFFPMNTLIKFLVEPRNDNLIETKHVLKYLRGTINYRLRYVSNDYIQLQGYTDSDWKGSAEDRKSTSRGCFSLGFAMIFWISWKHTSIALSTVKAKYIETTLESCVVWL